MSDTNQQIRLSFGGDDDGGDEHTDCGSVGVYGCGCVCHFYEFVAHEGPCWQVLSVELDCSSEVLHCLLVFTFQRVIIT